jgi:quinol monooxygenase YgiN
MAVFNVVNCAAQSMKQQPGFISAELSMNPIGHPNWVMSEKWESLEAYKAAVSTK